jgi:hypothetical protein
MRELEAAQDEFTADAGEFGSDSFEFDHEFNGGTDSEIESPLDEIEEMELATELLSVSSEEELDQFLGKLFKGVWKGIRKFGKFVGKVARPLGGLLKGIAKKALPFLGGALGSFIPIPGVGTAIGSALGGAASKLLEVDLEGMSPGDQEFELARRFVRLASKAAARAAAAGAVEEELAGGPSPQTANAAAIAAVRQAARQLDKDQATAQAKQARGRWLRRGNKIVLHGA